MTSDSNRWTATDNTGLMTLVGQMKQEAPKCKCPMASITTDHAEEISRKVVRLYSSHTEVIERLDRFNRVFKWFLVTILPAAGTAIVVQLWQITKFLITKAPLFLVAAGILGGCYFDTRVINGTDQPVPTAPMAVVTPDGAGGVMVNPQMGPPPDGSKPTPARFDFTWLEIVLGIGSLVGIPAAGAGLTAWKRAQAALKTVVKAIETTPEEAAKPVKSAIAQVAPAWFDTFVQRTVDPAAARPLRAGKRTGALERKC